MKREIWIQEMAQKRLGVCERDFDKSLIGYLNIPAGYLNDLIEDLQFELGITLSSSKRNSIVSVFDLVRAFVPKETPRRDPAVESYLENAGPLDDPVRHWSQFIIPLIIFNCVLAFFDFGSEHFLNLDKVALVMTPVVLLLVVLGGICAYYVHRPVIQLAREADRVIFLRAFVNDQYREDRLIRTILKSALPFRCALSGIRAPRNRSFLLFQMMGDFVKAYRYIGTETFELEARDRNWLARLLATIGQSRAIVMDARVVTTNLRNEIGLLLKLDAWDRIYFIVESDQSRQELKKEITSILGEIPIDNSGWQFLTLTEDFRSNPKAMAECWRQVLSDMPKYSIIPQKSALEYVQMLVPKCDWNTHFWEKPAMLTTIVIAGTIVGAFFLPDEIFRPLAITQSVIFLFLQGIAGLRLWKSANRQIELGGKPYPTIRTMQIARLAALAPVLIVACYPIILLLIALIWGIFGRLAP